MLEEGFFDPEKPFQLYWGDLPHLRQDGALYFVTFRLSDSLPQILLDTWRRDQRSWSLCKKDELAPAMKHSMEQRKRIERWLDQGYGSCILTDRKAKHIVTEVIRHFEGVRYELGDFAVASNHEHVLIRTALDVDLSQVLYSWKRFSSAELRRIGFRTKSIRWT